MAIYILLIYMYVFLYFFSYCLQYQTQAKSYDLTEFVRPRLRNLERCSIIYNDKIAQLAMRVVLSRAKSNFPGQLECCCWLEMTSRAVGSMCFL